MGRGLGSGGHGAGGAPSGEYSKVKTFGNIFISFVGAGVLGLPYAFSMAGVIEGTLIMVMAGYFSVKAMLMLVDCKNHIQNNGLLRESKTNPGRLSPTRPVGGALGRKNTDVEQMDAMDEITETLIDPLDPDANAGPLNVLPDAKADTIDYGDVAMVAFGDRGWWAVQMSIVSSQIGFCCAYIIFIMHNLSTLIDVTPNQILVLLIAPLMFLANIRDLSGLAVFSLFANAVNIFAYCVVFTFDFSRVENTGLHGKAITVDGLPFFLGVSIYCYEGAGMIISLETSVPKEHRHEFPQLFKSALLVITLLYIVFGVAGYVSYGSETDKIITLNMPDGVFPSMVKACLSFSLFFTFPVMMFPVSTLLEKLSAGKTGALPSARRIMLRCGLVLLTVFFVILIPDFAIIMGLIGSSCCMLLALILPGLIHLELFKRELTTRDKVFDYVIIALGCTGSILGLQDAITRIIHHHSGGDGDDL